jgi:hypothetical protein
METRMFDFTKPVEVTVPENACRLNPHATEFDPPEVRIAAKAMYILGILRGADRIAIERLQQVISWELEKYWEVGEPTSPDYQLERDLLQQILANFARMSDSQGEDAIRYMKRRERFHNPGNDEWDDACQFVLRLEERARDKLCRRRAQAGMDGVANVGTDNARR